VLGYDCQGEFPPVGNYCTNLYHPATLWYHTNDYVGSVYVQYANSSFTPIYGHASAQLGTTDYKGVLYTSDYTRYGRAGVLVGGDYQYSDWYVISNYCGARIYFDGTQVSIGFPPAPQYMGATGIITNDGMSGVWFNLTTNENSAATGFLPQGESDSVVLTVGPTNGIAVWIESKRYDEEGNLVEAHRTGYTTNGFAPNSTTNTVMIYAGVTNRSPTYPSGDGYGGSNPATEGSLQAGLAEIARAIRDQTDVERALSALEREQMKNGPTNVPGTNAPIDLGIVTNIHNNLTNTWSYERAVNAGEGSGSLVSNTVGSTVGTLTNWSRGWLGTNGTGLSSVSNRWQFTVSGVTVNFNPRNQDWYSGLTGFFRRGVLWVAWLVCGVGWAKLAVREMAWIANAPQSTSAVPLTAIVLGASVVVIIGAATVSLCAIAYVPTILGSHIFSYCAQGMTSIAWVQEAAVLFDDFVPFGDLGAVVASFVVVMGVILGVGFATKALVRVCTA